MKIITISREFGSGGRELGKRLADFLGYDYYDSEIISMIAEKNGLDKDYIETILSSHEWKNQSITFCNTLSSFTYTQASMVDLLLQQKNVIEGIAAIGKNFIIVGRNADIILRDYDPFNIFVCAEKNAKIRRCKERALKGENLSEKELIHKMKQIDKVRSETREIMSSSPWGQRDSYHITVNTTDWNIKELVPAVAAFAMHWFRR